MDQLPREAQNLQQQGDLHAQGLIGMKKKPMTSLPQLPQGSVECLSPLAVPIMQDPAGFGERTDSAGRWETLNIAHHRQPSQLLSVSGLVKQIKASPAQQSKQDSDTCKSPASPVIPGKPTNPQWWDGAVGGWSSQHQLPASGQEQATSVFLPHWGEIPFCLLWLGSASHPAPSLLAWWVMFLKPLAFSTGPCPPTADFLLPVEKLPGALWQCHPMSPASCSSDRKNR